MGQEDLKGIPQDIDVTFNLKADTIIKIEESMENSNIRRNHKDGRSGKHEKWSRKDLDVGIHLKILHGVFNAIIQITTCGGRPKTKLHDGSKCLDQGDGRNEGGTCIKPKRLCSEGEQGAMTTGHGKAKNERMIWWIGWQQ